MRIRKRCVFNINEKPELLEYLNKNNIEYEQTYGGCAFEIYTDDPLWNVILKAVEGVFVYTETEYSSAELQSAQWLSVRSKWQFGYPQPELTFITANKTYDLSNECSECGCGTVQAKPFRIKKTPKWGKRFFGGLHWIGDELFVNDAAKQILVENQVSGISFMDVLDKNGKERLPDISQLVITDVLELGLIGDKPSIRQQNRCSLCGKLKTVISGTGPLYFHKEIFEGQKEIVKTGDLFGSMHYVSRDILIQQRVYQLLKANKLDRGLVFEPVVLE